MKKQADSPIVSSFQPLDVQQMAKTKSSSTYESRSDRNLRSVPAVPQNFVLDPPTHIDTHHPEEYTESDSINGSMNFRT